MNPNALLLVGNSMHDASLYYFTRFLTPSTLTYIRRGKKEFIVLSQMEVERAKKESRVKDVRPTTDYGIKELVKKYQDPRKVRCELLYRILCEEKIEQIKVPANFPFFLAEGLQKKGIGITLTENLEKVREVKSKTEIECIIKTQCACEKAMKAAIDAIKSAEIRGDSLDITSERVRCIIEHALVDEQCTTNDTIVACGKQASNPHCTGHGMLKKDAPIVIDIFPYHRKERYHADMSRTVLRGDASAEIVDMYQAVLDAQNVAFDTIKAGVTGEDVHNVVCDLFEERGYSTERKGAKTGFIHSTGHGVGIEIHEGPSLSIGGEALKAGNVVTVEPGLYDPRIGGVRIEDMVLVSAKGCKNLTKFPKQLVI